VFVFGEALAIERGDLGPARVYEVGEGIGQSELGGPQSAIPGGAEQPWLRAIGAPRQGARQPGEGMIRGKPVLEMRPGNRPASTLKVSATLSGL
jgi:hypothetical protein